MRPGRGSGRPQLLPGRWAAIVRGAGCVSDR